MAFDVVNVGKRLLLSSGSANGTRKGGDYRFRAEDTPDAPVSASSGGMIPPPQIYGPAPSF
jgi:hypothetical protein